MVDRLGPNAATSDPRGDPGNAQGSRVSQPEASCTRADPTILTRASREQHVRARRLIGNRDRCADK